MPHYTRSAVAALIIMSFAAASADALVVRFSTVLGDIDVRLYDTATPQTVNNFLNYMNDGDWDDTFFHRSVPGFVVQGGGFTFENASGVANVPTDPAVVNEPGISNLRGTIAMAKQGGDPNSATSQWFFNLADNSANLDAQNGGFTVFGRVLSGMDVVDQIAALDRVNVGGAFTDLPVRNWSTGQSVEDENLVNVSSISQLLIQATDYDLDGDVDMDDYNLLASTWGSTTEADADGDGNGVVDLPDLNMFGFSVPETQAGGAGDGPHAPEPTTALLAGLALLGATAVRQAR